MKQKAIFLDRDGTLNIDYDYVHKIDDFDFIEGVIPTLRKFKEKGYLLVLVTNQSGIGRGIFTEEQFLELTQWFDWSLAEQGIDFDGIYYCPHHPEKALGEYKQECDCRKPKPGMFLQAIDELNIDPAQSFIVGDKLSDILAGENAGVKTKVLVRTGHKLTEKAIAKADYVLDSLVDLLKIL
ncbi:D-glycero-beta-D-manno-heptose 1,7-bisphosphate 7-phosphatase [Pasteurella skyensis]|uniref:D,D-heptose 1,7-bisphosphate phosphatase n=1 Tax=Phocoenobacter skyensis TaxID=97481 RepID=A0AAJ6P0A9_9PAST|nr:D-glycero-beta-D-manno-heptose 1,7-bisphosphate 7-phosphatase [Pasteurella skyensis]MDP8162283.1 D-glycero-beta-D-manno-heptose 1,7-bisphosphate 7-phosphatase [Pasteurella skyensis]MDP8172383.1 D-glycero-beta-D-manno-heptose 1,7-bisphosphate 7-phosphatase [Pasteurella skyensis]MDP8176964.1 D-glycero-beta-D-manno-heptose 1,7-bisphosphate 7-phosphatase [Pasteurella skyensis]MDP8178638.1 D-glycero-beta-D-manno-heptose 1,7-bisphosphate 7-phosphatase [Pasteurella skyensis]MDP8182640.1 D-glycero-